MLLPCAPQPESESKPDVFIGKPQIYAELIKRVDTLKRFYIGVLFKANNLRIRRIIEEIDGGVPLEESSDIDPNVQITRHEEMRLMCDYAEGSKAQEAIDRIVETHLDLIASIAGHFAESEDELEELINEGILVLLDRLDRYVGNGLMQIRFSTMLLNPLYDQLQRRSKELRNTVRIPIGAYDRAEKYDMAVWENEVEGGEAIPMETHAKKLGIEPETLVKSQELLQEGDQIESISSNTPAPIPAVDEVMHKKHAVNVAAGKVNRLTRKQEAVMRDYYGVKNPGTPFDDNDLTFEEIGAAQGTSRANVHELQVKALAHIRRALHQREIETPQITL
jgi:RNA polymerase sigma factor (sigma-70 family)